MHNEVKYARMSCMSLKPNAAVFRLKRQYKNLTTDKYADNLIAYLNNASCCKTITVEDLNNVMRGITGRSMDGENQQNQTTDDSEIPREISDNTQLPPEYQIGEHVIAFWLEGNEAKWHLGVVEGLKNGNPVVSYMIHGDSKGKS